MRKGCPDNTLKNLPIGPVLLERFLKLRLDLSLLRNKSTYRAHAD